MAEGGIAAALGNVYPEDNWQVHFRDTMRGGKLLSNWRMAQIHAQEAPERVLELEEWGALFDRTPDGRILQRDFGGHRFARLAHVGDRTGLEMIRTLQHRATQAEIEVFMECTITRLLKDGDRIAGAFGYWRESGRFVVFEAPAVVLATGGIGKAYKITSNSWEYTGDGHALALWAGADLIDMEFVQFHPTGMVWPPSVRGILVTEGVRGDGGVLRNSDGERFMFRYIPEMFRAETADTEEEADRWYTDKTVRRTPDLLPRDEVARAINAEIKEGRGQPPRRRVPRHRHPPRRRLHHPPAARHVPPVPRAGRRRHHQGADGGRPHLPLHDGRRPGRRRDPGVHRARAVRRGRGGRRAARRQPPGRQLAVGPAGVRPAGRAARGRVRGRARPRRPASTPRELEELAERGAAAVRQRRHREPLHHPAGSAGVHAGPGRDHPHRGRADQGARGARLCCASGPVASASRGTGSTTRAGTSRSTSTRCSPCRSASPGPPSNGRESRGAQTREDFPSTDPELGNGQHRRAPARR